MASETSRAGGRLRPGVARRPSWAWAIALTALIAAASAELANAQGEPVSSATPPIAAAPGADPRVESGTGDGPTNAAVAAAPADAISTATAAGAAGGIDPAAVNFLNKCASCHTVGGAGIGNSPDLLPSTQWPRADLATAIERMEKNVGPLEAGEVEALTDLLRAPDVQARLEAARQEREARRQATAEPGLARTGEALFHGAQPLARRGMACAACHAAGGRGGTLAADLTHVYDRMGETALRSAIENPSFPLMRPAYGARPLTSQEAAHLTAYLERAHASATDAQADPPAAAAERGFGWAGLLLAGVAMSGAALGLRRKDHGGVRARLVRQATRSER